MQEVTGFLKGERNYYNLGGDTGPLVYPAGFVYIFSLFKFLTNDGEDIFKGTLMIAHNLLSNKSAYFRSVTSGQVIFAAFDVAVTLVVLLLYKASGKVKFWWWPLLLLSKRVHSIFVLRLFNDGIAVFCGYAAIYLFINQKVAKLLLAQLVFIYLLIYLVALWMLIVLNWRINQDEYFALCPWRVDSFASRDGSAGNYNLFVHMRFCATCARVAVFKHSPYPVYCTLLRSWKSFYAQMDCKLQICS
jgi:hypothetical protein